MKQLIKFFLLLCGIPLLAQRNVDTTVFSQWNETTGLYKIRSGTNLNFTNAISVFKSQLNLTNAHQFTEYFSETDRKGLTHKKYQHTFNSIKVHGSQLYAHGNINGQVELLDWQIADKIDAGSGLNLSASQAINTALSKCQSSKYFWQDTVLEREIRELQNNPGASHYPNPELIYYPVHGNPQNNYTLCYKMTISSVEPFYKDVIYINAATGVMESRLSQLDACHSLKSEQPKKADVSACNGNCFGGMTNTLFYGAQNINVSKKTFGIDCKYYLRDRCNQTLIHTRSKTVTSYNSGSPPNYEYTDQTTYFNYVSQIPGGTTHWGAEMALDFYRNVLNREGMNGQANDLLIYCNSNALGVANAYFDRGDNSVHFGSGNNNIAHSQIAALDIVGHEISHGLVRFCTELEGFGEHGALNEGFSDILGTMSEYYAKYWHSTSRPFSYVYGDENYNNTTFQIDGITLYAFRDMTYPKNTLTPDTYGGTYWSNPTNLSVDNGGKHVNCTILDYWFYLLCEGGNGTNDNSNAYCVKKIGKDAALAITYEALKYHIKTYSNFNAARLATIQAASDLYGAASDEVAQVTAAWYAVGVGGPFTGQVNYSNQTVNSQTDIHYNSKVSLQNVTANAPSLYVTSNTEIELINDVNLNAGSWVELYIAPVSCSGAARLINPNGDGSGRGQTANATTQSNSARSAVPVILNENDSRDNTYIQPNPSNGVFTLLLNENRETPQNVTVLDYQGKVVKEFSTINRHELDVNITELNTGIYFVKITYPDAVLLKKIVKN